MVILSIKTQIERLAADKAALKQAIEAHGITVPNAATLSGYAALVAKIPTVTVDSILSASSTNPVQNKVVYKAYLWLYKGTATVDGWTASGSGYTQTVAVAPVDGGPAATDAMNYSAPMTEQAEDADTRAALQGALNLINSGKTIPGAASATIYVASKPDCDIPVYWYAR